ncbi:MAG: class I SAM-dependent methyltransferase [Actinomycetota bacterium]|nr:class I SAM-dependent methyltransferase [Actinomycetota bacterium]
MARLAPSTNDLVRLARRAARQALGRSEPLDRLLRQLRRADEVAALQREVTALRDERDLLNERLARAEARAAAPSGISTVAVARSVLPFLSESAPGHFYSPVPDLAEIEAQAGRIFDPNRQLTGVDLRSAEQRELFSTLAALARQSPFRRVPGTAGRYGVDNPNYGIGDASMLAAMLRHLRPKRYFEVGSGFSTAVALDVNEQHLDGALEITAVEPYPELLGRVLRDEDDIEVIAAPVQQVPLERFSALEANDVLFIDSSHVLKTGSDVHFLYTEVLPLLAEGVVVHIHDVFYPFEYLRHWVEWGRAWNEDYLLHAFLCFNSAFEILLWNHYLAQCHRELIAAELPAMLENTGGALWMRRTGPGLTPRSVPRRGAPRSAPAPRDGSGTRADRGGAGTRTSRDSSRRAR